MIDRQTIDKIFEAARIEEVVGDFVSLKKRGANLLGLCPFHNEKTPSFNVSPARGIYKCFGCGKGGNPVNFIMEHEHLTYPEALRFLARKYSIEIEEKEESPEEIQAHNEKESLMLVSGFAQQFFTETLLETEDGKAIGMPYFIERGFTTDTVAKFQLGYSPEKRTALAEAALAKGYKSEYLEATGLCIKRDDGTGIFDRFAGRVMFPIHNVSGRVIAFGGRTLKTDKKVAKYVNSPESPIYHKSNVLYGIYFAKNKIVSNDNCLLVEGYTDVISMHQAGIENVVSSSGTSLTVEQIRLIKRYTKNITILYDGDAAGIKASFRGIDLVLEEGMNVKVVLFPEGDDPDSFSKKVGGEELQEFIKKESKDFIGFKTGLLLKDIQNDPIAKAGLIREIMETISLIPDAISRNVYTSECSRIMNVDEQLLISELNKTRRKNFTKNLKEEEAQQIPESEEPYQHPQPVAEKAVHDFEDQERDIIRLLITYGDKAVIPAKALNEAGEEVEILITVAEFIYHDLTADNLHFDNLLYQLIFNEAGKAIEKGIIPDEKYYVQNPDDRISGFAAGIMSSPYALSINWLEKHKIHTNLEDAQIPKSVKHSIYSLKVKRLMKKISETEEQFATAKTEEETIEILEQHKLLLDIKRKIATEELGRIVLR
ncbi:MAG: DNA primase [Bacteroidia bacterium]